VAEVANAAMTTTLTSANDYLRVWLELVASLRRMLQTSATEELHKKELKIALRNAFQSANAWVVKCYPEWVEARVVLLKAEARCDLLPTVFNDPAHG
jgi:hypothetical protein